MIVVVDYGMGNLGSVLNMFRRLGVPAVRSSAARDVAAASKLVLPGVGAFDRGMESIRELGLEDVLHQKALEQRVPVLGICLGMQLMGEGSEEGAETGLGWFSARAVRFRFDSAPGVPPPKVPHMGWSYVHQVRAHPLLEDGGEIPRFYFVHSYHLACDHASDVVLAARYGGVPFVAAVGKANILGVQFHPEKSHRFGMALFRRFAAMPPAETAAA